MKRRYRSFISDIVIVVAGIVGLATAIEAKKHLGGNVIVFDPYGEANEFGASGDGLRLFRTSYYENPAYVPLLLKSMSNWKQLDPKVYCPVGGFYAGPPDCELIAGAIESANLHGLPHEVLSIEQSRDRFPVGNLPSNYIGFFEPQAGYVLAARATRAMAQLARSMGIKIIRDRVLGFERDTHWWFVRGEKAGVESAEVIVAAGAETSNLVPRLKPYLRAEPHVVAWMGKSDDRWDSMPGFGIMNEDGEMLYGFPSVDKDPGVKIGGHHKFSSGDHDSQVAGLQRLAGKYLTGLTPETLSTKTCTYDMSPDGHFMIGKIDRRFSVACGFSGHGFKFGSVIGEVVWQAHTTGLPKDLSFLDVNRFTSTSGLT